jgi:phosphate transport system substrate-binding protein
MAEELDYVPMPDSVVEQVQKMWSADIKDTAGKPIFAMN